MDELKQTFGEHLEVLRKMLFRIIVVVVIISILIFCYKETIFNIVLSPCNPDFISYKILRNILSVFVDKSTLFSDKISLIATDISSQIVNHITISAYFGLLISSPFLLYEVIRYVSPALYENEKKYAGIVLGTAYSLFGIGLLISYYILFPISCRFLIGYSVSSIVTTMVTLDSYISLFISLSFLLGVIFEMPVLCYVLCKMGILDDNLMIKYRKYAFIIILVLSTIITPPDVLTQIIVALPLYMLYELSIIIVKITIKHSN